MQALWNQILDWGKVNAPEMLEDLAPGASD